MVGFMSWKGKANGNLSWVSHTMAFVMFSSVSLTRSPLTRPPSDPNKVMIFSRTFSSELPLPYITSKQEAMSCYSFSSADAVWLRGDELCLNVTEQWQHYFFFPWKVILNGYIVWPTQNNHQGYKTLKKFFLLGTNLNCFSPFLQHIPSVSTSHATDNLDRSCCALFFFIY